MSGHNKWSQIKHKKAVSDAKKSKEFARLARAISVESRKARGDCNAPALAAVIARARAGNMPRDNIDRAVTRGVGSREGEYDEALYEAYGPGGVAILIETLTDNKKRTSAEIKHILSLSGASLAVVGSASWAFEKTESGWRAMTVVTISQNDARRLTALVHALTERDDVHAVYTNKDGARIMNYE